MHLRLEDGLDQHVIHSHPLGDSMIALLLVRRQQRDEGLMLSLYSCLLEFCPDFGSSGWSVTIWHAEVHQNKPVDWLALCKPIFDQFHCFGTIAAKFALEIELQDQGLDGHHVEWTVVHDKNFGKV